jgi:thiol reductant ABC exporter CydD subunit
VRPLDPRLLRHARPAAPYLAAVVALGAVTAACVILQARLLATGVAAAFTGGPLPGGPIPGGTGGEHEAPGAALLTTHAVVVAVRVLAAWASEIAAHKTSTAAKSQLRAALLAKILRTPGRRRDTAAPSPAAPSPAAQSSAAQSSAALSQLATSGLEGLDGYFTGYLPALVLAALVPVTVTVVVAVTDPLSGLVVAVTLPLVPLFGALSGMAAGREARRRWRALATLSHHFLDVVTGLPTLKVFGRAEAQRDRIAEVTDHYRTATMATLRLAFAAGLATDLIATMSVALVATETGLRLAYGHLGLATALTVLILAPEAYLPLRTLSARFHTAADGLAAAEEVFAILAIRGSTRLYAGETAIRRKAEGGAGAEAGLAARGGVAAGGGGAGVVVDRLVVRHEGRVHAAPDGVSLVLVPGRVTAVAGASGCGKSTLIGVLLGFTVPAAGGVSRIIRDDAGWLPQDPTLFAGTVAGNIRLGFPGASGEAVAEAAGRAALDDVPLDRILGERGTGLSAGQRRRVALARALLAGRPFLLLDEPTAGIDAEREAVITATLRREAREGRAVLVVSHRRAVLAAADEVVYAGVSPAPSSPSGKTPAGSVTA